MATDKIVVHVNSRVRHRWAMRLAFWLLSLATVDIEADGRRVGSRRIVELFRFEEDS